MALCTLQEVRTAILHQLMEELQISSANVTARRVLKNLLREINEGLNEEFATLEEMAEAGLLKVQ